MAPVFETVTTSLREMVGGGQITAEESHRMTIPTVGRTEKDFFARRSHPPADSKDCPSSISRNSTPKTSLRALPADRDADAFGAIGLHSCGFRCSGRLRARARGRRRPLPAGWFVDHLEAAVRRRLASAPEEMSVPQVKVVLVKRRSA